MTGIDKTLSVMKWIKDHPEGWRDREDIRGYNITKAQENLVKRGYYSIKTANNSEVRANIEKLIEGTRYLMGEI